MYKKIRYYFRFLSALISKYFPFLVAGIFLSVCAILAAPHIIKRLPTFRFTKRIAIVGRHTLTDLPSAITQKVSLGLTSVDPSGKPGPGVAKSWEVSEDGKTITFTLDEKFRWQNKNELNSQDIKYQFRDAVIEYPDNDHLVFRLKDPFAPLPTLLAKPILHYETSRLFSKSQVIGLGSYLVSGYKSNGPVLENLTLSPDQPESRLPILLYQFYSSPAQARTAFKLGLVDEIDNLPDLGDLKDWPNTTKVAIPSKDRYIALFFNTQSPNFGGAAGKNLRLAVSYAIDKNRWANRAISPIEPNNWAFNPETKKYDLDQKRASDLIKKVEKVPEKLIINTVPAYVGIAESIKADLEKIQLNSEIVVVQDVPETFDMLLIAQATPLDPDQYNFWHSTQESTNLTRLNNPRIDKLLEDGRKVYNSEERKKIYQDFQKYLVEEAPAVFLFYPELYTISRK
jgi:peptide/nickel transport system substrate-binding protein